MERVGKEGGVSIVEDWMAGESDVEGCDEITVVGDEGVDGWVEVCELERHG